MEDCLIYSCMCQNTGYIVDAQCMFSEWLSDGERLRKEQEDTKVGTRPGFASKPSTSWLCALGIVTEPL